MIDAPPDGIGKDSHGRGHLRTGLAVSLVAWQHGGALPSASAQGRLTAAGKRNSLKKTVTNAIDGEISLARGRQGVNDTSHGAARGGGSYCCAAQTANRAT